MIFRFDDICLNTDMKNANEMAKYLNSVGHRVLYAVSLLSQRTGNQFVFDPILKAYSDHRLFFGMSQLGMPDVPDFVEVVSHGIVHVDHRLLSRDAQELSIISSCSLLDTLMFAPPFNKWNDDTEVICIANDIELQKFEDGWRGVEHNAYSTAIETWYLHSRNLTLEKMKKWMGDISDMEEKIIDSCDEACMDSFGKKRIQKSPSGLTELNAPYAGSAP
jgi:hypothetical protein